jgi:hypothetical protein
VEIVMLPNCCENWILEKTGAILPGTTFACLPYGHKWRSIDTDDTDNAKEIQFCELETNEVFRLTTEHGVRCLKPINPDHKLRTNRCCTLDLLAHGPQITQSMSYTCVHCGTQWEIQGHKYSPAENIYTNRETGEQFDLVYAKKTTGAFLNLKLTATE